MTVGRREVMRQWGCTGTTAMCQPEASPLTHGHCQPELSAVKWEPHSQGSKSLAWYTQSKANWLHGPTCTFSVPYKGKEPEVPGQRISCWGSTVVQVRSQVGSCVCSVGSGSR